MLNRQTFAAASPIVEDSTAQRDIPVALQPAECLAEIERLRQSETELYALLRAARQYVPNLTLLALAIDEKWPTPRADQELVLEQLPSGEFAWLRAEGGTV